MELVNFIQKFAEQFDETNTSAFDESTHFKEYDEWSSLVALYIITMVDEEYNVTLKGEDIRKANTIGDIFKIVQDKAR